MRYKDLTGQKFGRLTVLRRVQDHYYPSGRHDVCYECECDCGNTVNVLSIHLRSGHTVSCGCYRVETSRDTFTTHGMTNTRLYSIWKNMRERCFNPNHKNFEIYGGRGITMCHEWVEDFANFAEWSVNNGYTEELTLDRIDVNRNYEPSNCRWVTQKDQCNNTRRNIVVEIDGETKTLKQWCEFYGLKYGTVSSRVKRGWSPKDAVLTPVRSVSEHI